MTERMLHNVQMKPPAHLLRTRTPQRGATSQSLHYLCRKEPSFSAALRHCFLFQSNRPGEFPVRPARDLYRALIKFHLGPLVVNLDTSSMYFTSKILNSMVFGLMTKLLQSVNIFETSHDIFARPNIIELKNLHRAGI